MIVHSQGKEKQFPHKSFVTQFPEALRILFDGTQFSLNLIDLLELFDILT